MPVSTLKKRNLMLLSDLILYMRGQGKAPHIKSKDEWARSLGMWLANARQKIKANRGSYLYLIEKAEEEGFPLLFECKDIDGGAIQKCQALIDYYKKHGRGPSSSGHNSREEYRLLYWQYGVRNGHAGQRNIKKFRSMIRAAGLPKILDRSGGLQKIVLDRWQEAIAVLKEGSGASEEAKRLAAQKVARYRWKKTLSPLEKAIEKKVQAMYRKAGLGILKRDAPRTEQEALQEVISYVKKYHKTPHTCDPDPQVKKIAAWYFYRLRLCRKRSPLFNKELEAIATAEGLPCLFEAKDRAKIRPQVQGF